MLLYIYDFMIIIHCLIQCVTPKYEDSRKLKYMILTHWILEMLIEVLCVSFVE